MGAKVFPWRTEGSLSGTLTLRPCHLVGTEPTKLLGCCEATRPWKHSGLLPPQGTWQIFQEWVYRHSGGQTA